VSEYNGKQGFQNKANVAARLKTVIKDANLDDRIDLNSGAVKLYQFLISQKYAPES